MYIRTLICSVCAFAVTLTAADRVVLKNGDTLTGTVVKKDGDKLTLKSEFLGEVTMPWSAVQNLQSQERLTVTLPEGTRVAGPVSTSGDALQVTTASGPRQIPFATVGDIRNPAEQAKWERLEHPGVLELWAGFFDIGLALARGNARTDTLATNFNAARATRKSKLSLHFNQIRGTARIDNRTSIIASAIRGGWSYNHDLTPRVFLSSLNEYETDRFQQLDLRFVAGGGAGFKAIRTPRTTFSILGGGDYSRENFFNHFNRNSGEVNFGNDVSYKLNGSTSLTQSFRFFVNLSRTGEYRVNFDLGTVTAIKKWLGWQLSASDRLLSNPPFGRQRNDLLLSTGLRISFAK
jgi:putative salt-induced outer membrane protein YdiY